MPIHVTTSTAQSLSNKTFVDYLSTTGEVYSQSGDSQQWNSTYSNVQANSSNWNGVYTSFSTQSADNASVYSTVQTNSADAWNYQGTDVKSLTSNWQSTYTSFSTQSANNASVYSTVLANSADAWNYQGTDVKALTSNWQSTYSSFSTQSADNASVYSTVQTNSADAWNYQGTDVKALTSNWENTYTTVNANSAQWAIDTSIDTQVRSLTSNWENTYTSFSTQSADNASVYSTVQSNSATWGTGGGSGIDSGVRELTGNWESTYSTVQSNSATWGTGGGGGDPTNLSYTRWQLTGDGSLDTFSIPGASTDVEAAFRVTIDAVIQDPASYTVDSSADTIVFSSVPQLSSNIVIIETQTQASQSLTVLAAASGDWNSTYSTVQSNSAAWTNDGYNEIWIGAGAMISPSLSGATSTTLPITGSGNEIYVDAFNFDAASINYAQFTVSLPQNSNKSSIKAKFYWTASEAGDCVWSIQGQSFDTDITLDAAWGPVAEVIDNTPGSSIMQTTSATTNIVLSGTTSTDCMLQFRVSRNSTSLDDTLPVAASLAGVKMQYAITSSLTSSW